MHLQHIDHAQLSPLGTLVANLPQISLTSSNLCRHQLSTTINSTHLTLLHSVNMHPPGTQPYVPSLPARPPMPTQEPFRFLDLPKDIRLVFYDLLPTVTHHHTIHGETECYWLKIVTQHIAGLAILRTCRTINDEARRPLRKKADALRTEPLRLIVHWRVMGGSAMQAVVQCAAHGGATCDGNRELNLLMPVEEVPDSEAHSPAANLHTLRRDVRYVPDIHCPFTSHKGLHALIDRNMPPNTRRKVEVAIGCTEGIKTENHEFVQLWSVFYHWVRWLQLIDTPGQVDMVLRLMPANDEIAALFQDYRTRAYADHIRWSFGQHQNWKCEIGEWVLGDEWVETWAEG